jgi:hypothetical protein
MLLRRLVIACLAAATQPACGVSRGETVPGPETSGLLAPVHGYVVIAIPRGGIDAIRLPDLQHTVVRPAAPPQAEDSYDLPTVHMLSGPDAAGHIAYVEDHFFVANEATRRHLLKTIQIDGSGDTELFTRPGDAMWAASGAGRGEIGEHIALSPVGGRVAFVSALKPVQMPSALLHVGDLEVWDVERKHGARVDLQTLDEGLAWFPDGHRLAYVKLIPAAEAGLFASSEQLRDNGVNDWSAIPSVYVRDVERGTESFLHVGWRPVVATDGQTVLISGVHDGWMVVDVTSHLTSAATWRGSAGDVIAYAGRDLVLAWCLPTEGSNTSTTKNNSPLVGPKQNLALKLAHLNSGEFQTAVPVLDPRRKVSFGFTHR